MSALSIAAVDALDVLNPKPIDLWDAWLFAEAEASLALATWTQAADGDKANAHATYAAAGSKSPACWRRASASNRNSG